MKIGYQLFSAFPLCKTKEGLINTIKQVAQMGYDGVEFFTYCGIPANEMKQLLDESNIVACNSHIRLEQWESNAEGEIIYAKEAGIPMVTIPWLPPELRNADGLNKLEELIPRLLELCNKHGIKLAYHNHEFEFEKLIEEKKFMMDAIIECDVQMMVELDTFWINYAKVNPISYLEKIKNRIDIIHIKDYISLTGGGIVGDKEMPTFCSIGLGQMENTPIINWAKEKPLSWIVVEQDNSQIDIMESAKLSIEYLKSQI
ncbi:MAG: sugar phosphate isomerase/epimerase family protein [Lachnospiraceae bacterium]